MKTSHTPGNMKLRYRLNGQKGMTMLVHDYKDDLISRKALIEVYKRNSITEKIMVGEKSVMQHLLDAHAVELVHCRECKHLGIKGLSDGVCNKKMMGTVKRRKERHMKLFKDLKKCKGDRKEYRVKPTINFSVDTYDYCFSFIPTVVWMPWIYRSQHIAVVDVWWLHFHILIGTWEKVDKCES